MLSRGRSLSPFESFTFIQLRDFMPFHITSFIYIMFINKYLFRPWILHTVKMITVLSRITGRLLRVARARLLIKIMGDLENCSSPY